MPRIIRRLLANLILIGVSCAAALLLGEFVVRRVAPQPLPLAVALRGLHRPDPELGYVMVPGFRRLVHASEFTCDVRTNALGLRDRDYGPALPGTLRILGLGDSFAFGVHAGDLDNCFLKQLESRLGRDLAAHPRSSPDGRAWRAVQVVNAGVDGYGTPQEVGLLQRLGEELHPDAVLLAFHLGNDFTDNSGRTRMTVMDGYQMLEASAAGYRAHSRPLHRRARQWLCANSALYQLFKEEVLHPTRALLPQPTGAASAAQPFDYYIYDAAFAHCMQDDPNPDVERALRVTGDAFAELRRWCDAHSAAVLVVAIPAEQQVSRPARRQWLQRFGLEAQDYDFTLPNRRLAALAAQAGLPLYDLTDAFAAHSARGENLHLRSDTHWNAAGHALAGELLVEPVLEQLVEHAPGTVIGSR